MLEARSHFPKGGALDVGCWPFVWRVGCAWLPLPLATDASTAFAPLTPARFSLVALFVGIPCSCRRCVLANEDTRGDMDLKTAPNSRSEGCQRECDQSGRVKLGCLVRAHCVSILASHLTPTGSTWGSGQDGTTVVGLSKATRSAEIAEAGSCLKRSEEVEGVIGVQGGRRGSWT